MGEFAMSPGGVIGSHTTVDQMWGRQSKIKQCLPRRYFFFFCKETVVRGEEKDDEERKRRPVLVLVREDDLSNLLGQ